MAKTSIIPTIILKDEDLKPLLSWQQNNRVQIHVWHVFYDLAYGISLESAMENISSGLVQPTQQTYQAPNGVITTKSIYKFGYYLGYPLGESTSEPNLHARFIVDKNGHILPFVHFEGGDLQLSREAKKVLVDQK